jgi:hypothetical protein
MTAAMHVETSAPASLPSEKDMYQKGMTYTDAAA